MKYKTRKLTVELLKNTLFYDEEKNQFIWRYTQGANARMGTVAGYNRAKDGKRYINLFRIAYPFAILVHFYKTGEWLEGIAPGTSLDEIKRLTNKSEKELKKSEKSEKAR